MGTGQATTPFVQAGYDVTGLELGDKLSQFAAEKYREYDNFRAVNADFMNCDFDCCFDLVYCATAFHWLPVPDRYDKVRQCLKPGGTLALFWNHPFPNRENDKSNMASKAVYDKYRPSDKKQVEFNETRCKRYAAELMKYDFTDAEYKLYYRTRTLSTSEYLQLINTYSDHITLPPSVKQPFEKDMKKAIDNAGGKINIYDTIDLYLAKKR